MTGDDATKLLNLVEATIQAIYAVGDACRDQAEDGPAREHDALERIAEEVEDSSFRWNALAYLLQRHRDGAVDVADLLDDEVWETATKEVELLPRGDLSRRLGGPGAKGRY